MNLFVLNLLLIVNIAVSTNSYHFPPDLSHLLDQYDSHYFISFIQEKTYYSSEEKMNIFHFCGPKIKGTCRIYAFHENVMKPPNFSTAKFVTQFVNILFIGDSNSNPELNDNDLGYKNPFLWLYLTNRLDNLNLRSRYTSSSILLAVTAQKVYLVCPICTNLYWELRSGDYFPIQTFWNKIFSKYGALYDNDGKVKMVDDNNLCDLSNFR